jgi:N-acetylglucosaminyldiphosphoundecaprenol N-acetyl-beta-D-mannosaminyltransferase
MQESGASDAHFFIGSTESTLERLSEQLNFEFPNVKISGLLSPDFRMPTKKDLNEWSTKIDSSGAEFVWLSLGSPKQDIVAHQLAQITAANVIAIGAALDFFSKTKSEAPRIIQKSHLEWLFRLIMEPKRLWRRYTLGNVYFLFLVLKDMCGMS